MPPKKHSDLSASKAHRWIACPPSLKLEEQFPDSTSEYAAEGTEAHDLAEIKALYALGKIDDDEYRARRQAFKETAKYFNAEMEDTTTAYAKLAAAIAAADDDFHYTDLEVRVDYSKYAKGGFGTADFICVGAGEIIIMDFKYGKGVRVSAEDNEQMKLYALGVLTKFDILFDFDKVRMIIFQPRLSMTPSQATMTAGELKQWGTKVVKPAAALALNGEGEFNPSEKACKFCKAKGTCRARAQKNLKAFDEAVDPALLSLDEVGEVLANAADIKAWLKDLEKVATEALLERKPVAGWKLVEGRSNRKYADERAVISKLLASGLSPDVIFERKLLPLTTLEKTIGKTQVGEILGESIIKPPGKPSLAPASDPAPEYSPDDEVLAAFDD